MHSSINEQIEGKGSVSQKPNKEIFKKVGLILGPTAAIIMFLMPQLPGLAPEGKRFLGLLLWVVIWWATGPVHYSVTSLIPIFGMPLLKIMKIKEEAILEVVNGAVSFKDFSLATPTMLETGSKISISMPGSTIGLADPTIIFFLGLLILSGAMVVTGLDKRMSYRIIHAIGYSEKRLLLGVTLSTALVSSFISNTSATAIHLPIAKALIKQLGVEEDSNFAKTVTLTCSYASTLGGGSTITGRASLLLMVGMVSSISGIKISYFDWIKIAFVFSWGMVFLSYWYLQRVFPLENTIQEDAKEVIEREIEALGPMSIREKMVAVFFILAIILFMTEGVWSKFWFMEALKGYLTVQVIALFVPFLLFIIPINIKPLEFTITWKEISKHINWDVILVFSAGLTIAAAVIKTGVADWSARALTSLNISPILYLIFIIIFGSFLTEFISNTASMTLMLSVILPLHKSLGVDLIILVSTVAMASEFAFMLPSGTPGNAMILGTGGIDIPTMIKVGLPLKLMAIAAWLVWSFAFII